MLIVSHVSLKQMMSKLLVKTKFDRDVRLLELARKARNSKKNEKLKFYNFCLIFLQNLIAPPLFSL